MEAATDSLISLGWLTWALIFFGALVTSSVHGATGIAGGFLMAALLATIIGVKPVVPIMSIALLISHTSRTLLNARNFDRDAFFTVIIPALPCMAVAAIIYGKLSSPVIALVLGGIVFTSVPIRRWAKNKKFQTSRTSLGSAGAIYGGLSGLSVGPGMILIPFLLGFGLSKEAFVATLAGIALVANIVRTVVFGATDLLNVEYVLLGIIVGLLTIPGNWFGRSILRKMTTEDHSNAVDILTVLGALNFFWLAIGFVAWKR